MPTLGQLYRNSRSDRRLANAALAHGHDQTVASCLNIVD